jgi:hypothetical protein
MNDLFSTAINCMDGRVQIPVIKFMKEEHGVDYVDMITEPGPNKILARNEDKALIESIKKRVAISVEKHNSKLIAIVGHYDCAGNPADKETQLNHIRNSINTIESWKFNIQVIGLWVDETWHATRV